MIKIAHEAPLSIFNTVQEFTDYDYALVHLFEESEEYYHKFRDSISKGREVILDNSIFELGESFNMNEFSKWVDRLKPTWYIVPDALENLDKTIKNMTTWMLNYKDIPGKKIGVVQGKTYHEIKVCYDFLNTVAEVDMIAISFDYSYYETLFPHTNKYVSWMMGRVLLLNKLLSDNVINTNKKHHLLGCSLPQEGLFYKNGKYPWIYSIDTSNPVVHGLKNIRYTDQGLWEKESTKVIDLLYSSKPNNNLVLDNIQGFRQFWNYPDNSFYEKSI